MTTFRETTLTCPACFSEVPAFEITSTNQVGQDTDFCPRTMGFHTVPMVVSTCRGCGYSGYADDFEDKTLDDGERERFLEARVQDGLIPLEARLRSIQADHSYYLAFLTAKHFKSSHEDLADLLLRAYWCLRIDDLRPNDTVAASKYRTAAIGEFLMAIIESRDASIEDRRSWVYLVAELSRREGDFERAVEYYDRFLADPPPERAWSTAATALKELALVGDSSNLGFEEIIPEEEAGGGQADPPV